MNNRRKFLFGSLGVIAAGAAGIWFGKNPILRRLVMMNNNSRIPIGTAPGFDGDCVFTSEQTEGPFFVRSAMRKDIRDDRAGKEMTLKMKFVNAADCQPVAGATVEIWHCDAEGKYSGYPEDLAHDPWGSLRLTNFNPGHVDPLNEKRYLRGAQMTDPDGVCEFTTIVPGWYEPRCPHIHLKVFANGKDVFTGQFYLDEELTTRIYTTVDPYSKYGDTLFTMKNDLVISESKELNGVVLRPVWSDNGPVVASAKIGLRLA